MDRFQESLHEDVDAREERPLSADYARTREDVLPLFDQDTDPRPSPSGRTSPEASSFTSGVYSFHDACGTELDARDDVRFTRVASQHVDGSRPSQVRKGIRTIIVKSS